MALVVKNLVNILPVHPTRKYQYRNIGMIKGIIIHHFAGQITIREAALLHISKEWPGIGYHYVIDDAIYQTNLLNKVSYHCKGKNASTIGISVRGNYMKKLPSPAQLQMLQDLIAELRLINPAWYVSIHRKHVATSCPGDKLAEWVSRQYPGISSY